MAPVTRQCAGTAWPPTVSVPAPTSVLPLMLVLASDARLPARPEQAPLKLAGTAGARWGGPIGGRSSLSPPQPASRAGRTRRAPQVAASAPGRRVEAVGMARVS